MIRYSGIFIIICFPLFLRAQKFFVSGTVLDFSNKKPLESVSVFSSNGNFTISDSLGRYHVLVTQKDSIWFSYLGKNTKKYPIDTIQNTSNFEVGLHVDVAWLPEVRVRNRNYTEDSIENRKEYAKIFNYKKPGIALSKTAPSSYIPGSVTVGLDLDAFINMFRFKKNRQMLAFQKRLLNEEQDKYINHRFNKRFVRELTKLDSAQLENFMRYYKPPYEALLQMNDIELGVYIEDCFKAYMRLKN